MSSANVLNSVTVRECIRLYAVLTDRYFDYVNCMEHASQKSRDYFVRVASDYLDSVVPGWREATEVPFKLRLLVDRKYGRKVA